MRIQYVEVIGFGPFEEKTSVTFPEQGLGLIMGPNESGKSHLMKAIFGIIFGLTQDEVERYRGWYNPAEFEGTVRLSLDDTQIELVRYFDTQVAEIWDLGQGGRRCIFTGEAIPNGKDPTYFLELAKLVGFKDAEIATSTTFVTDRELETHVSDKLRQMIGGSKRADYEKILKDLRTEFGRLTRQDPWTGADAGADGEIERLERENDRLKEARTQVHEALRTSFKVKGEIRGLTDQYRQLENQVEEEQRALEGLSVLEGLIREETGLRDRCADIRRAQDTVRSLQEQLASSLDRVATEHAPLLPLQTSFLEDVQSLADARRELARVGKEVETERERRKDLQGQVKKRTEELQSFYGAFEDLPEDFPEKLSLFTTRQRELNTLRTELLGIEKRIAELQREVDENYPRFTRQDADYDEQLHALETREIQWRQQLKALDGEKERRRALEAEVQATQRRLQEEFFAYEKVAEDFPIRLRSWHTLWEELASRQTQVERARATVQEIQAELERDHPTLLNAPPNYEEALAAWRKLHARFESDMPRLEREFETVRKLHQEQEEAGRLIEERYTMLIGRVEPDFPEKLREHKRLREELLSKTRVLEDARERLKMAEDIILNRYARFLDTPSDWGDQLEVHRKNVEQGQAVLERLQKDEDQFVDLKRELETLNARASEEGDIFEGVSDSFPELLREFVRLKPEVDTKDQQMNELKETIHTLEEMALREYSDFFGVGDDFAERLVQYRSDRANQARVDKESQESKEAVTTLTERLKALDAALEESYPQFYDIPETAETTVAIILRDLAQRQRLTEEMSAVELQHWAKEQEKDQKSSSGIIGRIRRNTQKLTEDNSQKTRIEQHKKQIAEVDKAIMAAQEQLGPLRMRSDFEQLQIELAGHRKLLKERTQVAAQLETALAAARKVQASVDELADRLKRQKDVLDVEGEGELESKLPKFKEYRDHMARLNAARKVLKSHQTAAKGEEASGLTDLDKGKKRLAELAAGLGSFAERFSGPPSQYEDIATELIDGFRTYKRRKQEAQRLKARLSNMQSDKEIASIRQETVDMLVKERSSLGIQDDEVLGDLIEEWHEFERLQARVDAEEGIIRSHEQEMVEENDQPVSRLEWLRRRVDTLQKDIGELSSFPDTDALIENIQAYTSLKGRIAQIVEMLSHHTPREQLEREQEALREERQAGLRALGLPADTWPNLEELEPAWASFQKAMTELQNRGAALTALLETEGDTTILDRLQQKLTDLAQGLGDFTQLSDLDETVATYEEFKAVRSSLDAMLQSLSGIPSEAELDEAQFQIELVMENERDALGILPGETLEAVKARYKEYRQRMAEQKTQTEVRTRLLSTVWIGDRSTSTTEATLQEMHEALEELRASLSGFEDAGEEADEVINQFREAQQVKRDIEALKAAIKGLRSPGELEEWLNETRVPALALESRLKVAGDLTDLDALRNRFRVFEEYQQSISSARRGLEEHPTVEALEAQLGDVETILAATGERVKTLLEERSVLARYYEKFSSKVEEMRPTMTHNLSRLKENLSVLDFAVEKLRNTYRQHTQPTSGSRGNLAVLQEQIARRQGELDRLKTRRDGLQLAVDRLEAVVLDTQEHLVGSLQIRAQDILGGLTAGRYPEVTLEGLHLEPVVKNRRGVALRGDAIAGGLRDQLFFALRAAMAQEMAGNVRLPFILDDPLVQFDDERLENARQYLKSLSERTQVILFTHDERCRSWGQVLTDLGTPRLTSSQPAVADVPSTVASG